MSTEFFSRRHFRAMTDEELRDFRPRSRPYRNDDVAKANREMRRRAARAGLGHAVDWLATMPLTKVPHIPWWS